MHLLCNDITELVAILEAHLSDKHALPMRSGHSVCLLHVFL